MTFKEYLESINACQEAIDWVDDKTLEESWVTCTRPDWMLWLYGRNNPDKLICVKIAVYTAKLVLPIWQRKYPDDLRPQHAVEAAEKWIENPSEENRQEAEAWEAEAWAAASAWGAWEAEAWAAAAVARAAEAAARAAVAAARAAEAAARAAETAAAEAARAAETAAAKASVNKTLADYIRNLIPTIEIGGVK